MKEIQPLHTDTILLRAPEPEDIDEMLLFENDESLWENSCATGPYSRYQLKKYIAENQNNIFIDGQLRLMIEHTSGAVAGIIDLFSFDARHKRAEVGIVIKESYRRQLHTMPFAYWKNIVSIFLASINSMPTSEQIIPPA